MSNLIKKINICKNINLYYIKIDHFFENNMNYLMEIYCNAEDTKYIKNYINLKDQLSHLGSIILQKFFFKINHSNNKIKEKEIIIKKDKNNKPYIENFSLFYNISHDKDIVIGSFSSQKIGVDIMKDDIDTLESIKSINNIFLDEEKMIDYFILWTIIESYLKAIGLGFIDFEKRKFKVVKVNETFKIINGEDNSILYKKLEIENFYYHLAICILNII